MKLKKKYDNFIQRLHNLISLNELNKEKSVIWDNLGGKYGFTILNSNEFHKKCKEKMITKSLNLKSLFKQFNNYGFKYMKGFWYHPSNNFYKGSRKLNYIKFKDKLFFRKKKKNIIKRKYNLNNHLKFNYKSNNCILEATKDFLIDELFNSVEFDLNKDELEFLIESELL